MQITLVRIKEDEFGTHGVLKDETGAWLCYTLEQPWRNNQTDISCIPSDSYAVIPHNSAAHPDTWEVSNVPGRTAILIHSGNALADTKGCIICGLTQTKDMVLQSKSAIDKLHGVLPDYFDLDILPIIR